MSDYDVVVIGAGPGGYVCAIRASQLGLKTAIVDKEFLGGVCLNIGCVPSKSLLKNAEVAHTLRERSREFGFSFDNLTLDFGAAVKRSRQVSGRLTRGVGFLMKKNNIDVHMGVAKLTGSNTVQVTAQDGSSSELKAKYIVLATGSHPTLFPGINVDGEKVLTFREAILQTRLPESVVIIGAGAIGMEFATVWSAYGTKVTIVEMLPRVLPLEDEESSAEVTKAYNRRGIKTLTSHRFQSVEKTENGVCVKATDPEGQEVVIEAEQMLFAVGFRPNTQNLGLEEAGVKLTERGFIEVNDQMATTAPGIWAIGDLTGKLLLAHVASAQGMICAESIARLETKPLNYVMMPRATYCQPQVASFGYSETQARELGKEIKISSFPFQAVGKALGLGDYNGFVKIITDTKYGEILGAHLVGPEVTELLPELTLAQNQELTLSEISHNVHAHPTLSEAIMEAAHVGEGHPIHI